MKARHVQGQALNARCRCGESLLWRNYDPHWSWGQSFYLSSLRLNATEARCPHWRWFWPWGHDRLLMATGRAPAISTSLLNAEQHGKVVS